MTEVSQAVWDAFTGDPMDPKNNVEAGLARVVALFEGENEWQPIDTCPIRERVDLWCVYGDEGFAQFEGGSSIGRLVSNKWKTAEYGFYGNQSSDGIPQCNAPDLKAVAWRKSVDRCPAALIANVMGIPLTIEDALKGDD